jgi:CRISPR-associated protein Csm4
MSKTKIYYLEPLSGYRTPLRSDTLWGILCWGIRNLHGNDELEHFIESYEKGDLNNYFIISSAYPYKKKGSNYIPFFPLPKRPVEKYEPLSKSSYEDSKSKMRENKKKRKVNLVPKSDFEKIINGGAIESSEKTPKEDIQVVTHNTIDRLKGGTLELKGQGQLFHVEERFWTGDKEDESYGLYFLAKGNFDLLESVLRFLSHNGFGGDKSTGKGHFNIHIEDFELEEPDGANVLMNMSLYFPTKNEIQSFSTQPSTHFYYDIEARQGKLGGLTYRNQSIWKDVITMFKEGSVFPLSEEIKVESYGNNPIVKPQTDGVTDHDVYHYGKAFMIKMKIQ